MTLRRLFSAMTQYLLKNILPSLADENAVAIAYKREHRQRLQEYGHTRRSHKVSVLLFLSELISLNFKLRESN